MRLNKVVVEKMGELCETVSFDYDLRSNSFLFLCCLFIPFVPHKNCLAARDLRKREGRQREAKELSLPLVANEPRRAGRIGPAV